MGLLAVQNLQAQTVSSSNPGNRSPFDLANEAIVRQLDSVVSLRFFKKDHTKMKIYSFDFFIKKSK